jgi:hydroxyethylthiazole kinase
MIETAAHLLTTLRARNPRVHCITNFAAMNLTANMLLAIGATPSLTYAADEVYDFTMRADALLINLGTLDEARKTAIPLAISTGKPWVLDPVFVHRSDVRLNFAKQFMPHILRGNADELAVLKPTSGVIVQTGAIDHVRDGARSINIHNGHPLMAKVTAMGCAGTAIMAAALAVEKDAFVAACCALIWLGIAGEMVKATAPGSFQPAYLDALYLLDEATIRQKARIS